MKKKVGVITLYNNNNNYGGIAQSYAIQRYIESIGYECSIINYKRSRKGVFTIPQTQLTGVKRIKNALVRRIEMVGDVFLKNKIELRKICFAKSREVIPHTDVYDEENIQNCNKEFDIFISGSDQIWKPFVLQLPYVLNFVDSKKTKISYASSISQTELSDKYGCFMKKYLEEYKAISVREKDAKDYLEKTIGRKVEWVVDPVLLLSSNEWKEVCNEERIIKEDYIFCYLLGDRKEEREWAKKISKINKKKLVVFSHVEGHCRLYDIGFGDISIYEAGLPEFLSLIRDASCVITDSFHATVFSFLFEKQFYVLPRRNKNSDENMETRLTSVLTQMNLLERKISDTLEVAGNIEENYIDYIHLKSNIKTQIEFSKDFLRENLEEK
ncbi:MAG: polysaccharide pyruvyl transferase family protein [Anaerobutyricum soehngenii]